MKKLKQSKIDYFDKYIQGIELRGDYISINGYYKRLYWNVYSTLVNQFTGKARKEFEFYVEKKYESIEVFNALFKDYAEKIQNTPIDNFPLLFKLNNLGVECYKLNNPENKELTFIASSDDALFFMKVITFLRVRVKSQFFIESTEGKARTELCNLIATDDFNIKDAIKNYSNNPNEYCLCYIPLEELIRGHKKKKTPSWDFFLSNFDTLHQELFKAFVYSIFFLENRGRQLLWLEGEGDTGKSTAVNVISTRLQEFSPNLVGALETFDKKDKFDLEQLETARLAILSDTQEKKIFQRADIFNITGNDMVAINRKRRARITRQLFCKIIITSNYPPEYDKLAVHQASRIIHLPMNPKKVVEVRKKRDSTLRLKNLSQDLYNEFFPFLAKCKEYYEKYLKPDGSGVFVWKKD